MARAGLRARTIPQTQRIDQRPMHAERFVMTLRRPVGGVQRVGKGSVDDRGQLVENLKLLNYFLKDIR